MKIPYIYLKDIVAAMEALEKVDQSTEFLFTTGPLAVTDGGESEYTLIYEDDVWWLDTEGN